MSELAPPSSNLLREKVAIVSGVGPGLGRAIALALVAEGADLALGARNEAFLDDLCAEISELGGRAVACRADITDPADCERLARTASEAFGRVDILVNNGHLSRPQQRFEEADLGSWRPAMDVNYWGSLQMTQAALPYLREHDDSRVILVNTLAVARVREADGTYVGSKAALQAATRFLAADLGPLGVRVNSVHPGYMAQDKFEQHLEALARTGGTTAAALREGITDATPLRYIPSSEEVAGTVVFLASPLARPMTGQCLHVNAGYHFG